MNTIWTVLNRAGVHGILTTVVNVPMLRYDISSQMAGTNGSRSLLVNISTRGKRYVMDMSFLSRRTISKHYIILSSLIVFQLFFDYGENYVRNWQKKNKKAIPPTYCVPVSGHGPNSPNSYGSASTENTSPRSHCSGSPSLHSSMDSTFSDSDGNIMDKI